LKKKQSLLIVEDNIGLREQLKWALNDDYTVLEADSVKSCCEIFDLHKPSLVCLDMGLENIPDRGFTIIDQLLEKRRTTKIIVMTANTDIKFGTESIRKGAFDFLQKPVQPDILKTLLERALRISELELNKDNSLFDSDFSFCGMAGKSNALQQVSKLMRRLATTNVNVLITGESGTGKELCARGIHYLGERSSNPFVPINCGAIPETLIESELFGYVKGAFTGASADKTGLIESANGGTIFLDEIGDTPKHLQVKLLRFLEDQVVQRVGDTTFKKVDVRIIAATNKKNLSLEGNDSMRTDLYYRLSEFEIYLPPLRERGDDVIIIAENIVAKNRKKFNQPKLALSSRCQQLLQSYSWPGNIRELENKLNRASIICENQIIEPQDLQLSGSSLSSFTFKDARDLFEKEYFLNLLRSTDYNISEAARKADISRPTLYDIMKRHDISIELDKKIS
jgi:two-component system NtrC family response regulator